MISEFVVIIYIKVEFELKLKYKSAQTLPCSADDQPIGI